MTRETFEKAEAIRAEIDHYMDIRCALGNAHNKILKIVNPEDGRVINEVNMVKSPIIVSMAETVDNLIRELEKEFSEL